MPKQRRFELISFEQACERSNRFRRTRVVNNDQGQAGYCQPGEILRELVEMIVVWHHDTGFH
jgi:aerobic-type carbon monoxide dehydrogenase small subunit (CoxS/CutS family)